jgi:hypothetical protein
MLDRTVAIGIVLSALRDAVDQNGGDAAAVNGPAIQMLQSLRRD